MNRVLQELREELDNEGEQAESETVLSSCSFRHLLEISCHSSMPCDTLQKFQAIVQDCRGSMIAIRQAMDRAMDRAIKKKRKITLWQLSWIWGQEVFK
jgi:hypothetical protein